MTKRGTQKKQKNDGVQGNLHSDSLSGRRKTFPTPLLCLSRHMPEENEDLVRKHRRKPYSRMISERQPVCHEKLFRMDGISCFVQSKWAICLPIPNDTTQDSKQYLSHDQFARQYFITLPSRWSEKESLSEKVRRLLMGSRRFSEPSSKPSFHSTFSSGMSIVFKAMSTCPHFCWKWNVALERLAVSKIESTGKSWGATRRSLVFMTEGSISRQTRSSPFIFTECFRLRIMYCKRHTSSDRQVGSYRQHSCVGHLDSRTQVIAELLVSLRLPKTRAEVWMEGFDDDVFVALLFGYNTLVRHSLDISDRQRFRKLGTKANTLACILLPASVKLDFIRLRCFWHASFRMSSNFQTREQPAASRSWRQLRKKRYLWRARMGAARREELITSYPCRLLHQKHQCNHFCNKKSLYFFCNKHSLLLPGILLWRRVNVVSKSM